MAGHLDAAFGLNLRQLGSIGFVRDSSHHICDPTPDPIPNHILEFFSRPGEIDIMEMKGRLPNQIHSTLHYRKCRSHAKRITP